MAQANVTIAIIIVVLVFLFALLTYWILNARNLGRGVSAVYDVGEATSSDDLGEIVRFAQIATGNG